MRPRRELVAAIGLFSLIVSSLDAADGPLRIAVNATTIESFPVFAAADSLSARASDQRVELVLAPSGRAAMVQLTNGEVDAATAAETQALLTSVSDRRIRIVLTVSECRYRIVARRSAGIQRIADLRGKTIAVTANTSSHYYLTRMLRTADLRESDIRLVSLEGPDMPAALEKRAVDAVSIWEPHGQNSLVALGADAIGFEDPSAYTERFNLNTRSDVLEDPARRRALAGFIQEIARASLQIRARPDDLVPSLAPRIGLPLKTVRDVWPRFTFPAAIPSDLPSSLADIEAWTAAAAKRPSRTNRELAFLIDTSLTGEALRR